jgi:hypothetical protein
MDMLAAYLRVLKDHGRKNLKGFLTSTIGRAISKACFLVIADKP